MDASEMNDGDTAGICLLIGGYALAGITRENGRYYAVMREKDGTEKEKGQDGKDGRDGKGRGPGTTGQGRGEDRLTIGALAVDPALELRIIAGHPDFSFGSDIEDVEAVIVHISA